MVCPRCNKPVVLITTRVSNDLIVDVCHDCGEELTKIMDNRKKDFGSKGYGIGQVE